MVGLIFIDMAKAVLSLVVQAENDVWMVTSETYAIFIAFCCDSKIVNF